MNQRLYFGSPGAIRPARLFVWMVVGLGAAVIGSGCTSAEDKARKVIEEAVELCREAPADAPIYKVKVAGSKDDEILRMACDEPIEKLELEDNLIATAYTGPVQWEAHLNDESRVWVLTGADWSDLSRARRALDASDPSAEELSYAANHLKSAQEAFPKSAWLRLRRLEALLDLRSKERGPKTENAAGIGELAQAQFEETVAWADEQESVDTKVEAQFLVVEHLRRYLRRIDDILSSDGSSDEWLVNAAKQAEKDGDKEKAAEYLEELAEAQAERERNRELYGEREVEVHKSLCSLVTKLSPVGLENSNLQAEVAAAKEAVDCVERAAATE